MVRDISGVVGQATAKKRHIFRLVHRWYDMVWSHVGYDIWSYVWYGIWLLVWYCIKKRRIFRLIHSCQKCGQVQCSDDRWWVRTMLQTMLHTRFHCCTLLHTSHFISQKSTQRCTFHAHFEVHTTKRPLHTVRLFLKTSNKHKYAQCTKNVIKLQCFDISDYSCRPGFDAHRESINSKQIVSHWYF